MSRTLPSPVLAARRAFTMIELLVVVGIIAVLVGLSLVVGSQVMGGGKQRLTADAINVLDKALTQYIAEKGEIPPAVFVYTDGTPPTSQSFPMADARDMSNTYTPADGLPGNQMINSVGMFMAEAKGIPSVQAILDKLPSALVRTYDPDGPGPQPDLMTVFDAWGKPIRFVHPTWQGLIVTPGSSITPVDATTVKPLPAPATYAIARVRRNHEFGAGANAQDQPDSDGAQCKGNRPYFYSVGADGVVGVKYDTSNPKKVIENYNTDNVYLIQPNFTDK